MTDVRVQTVFHNYPDEYNHVEDGGGEGGGGGGGGEDGVGGGGGGGGGRDVSSLDHKRSRIGIPFQDVINHLTSAKLVPS